MPRGSSHGGIVANPGGDFKRVRNRQFQQKIDTNLSLAKPVRNEFCPLNCIEADFGAFNLGGVKALPTSRTLRTRDPVRSNLRHQGRKFRIPLKTIALSVKSRLLADGKKKRQKCRWNESSDYWTAVVAAINPRKSEIIKHLEKARRQGESPDEDKKRKNRSHLEYGFSSFRV